MVVKLGGSYAGSARRSAWLAAIAAASAPVVVVPGGGPFADAVRHEQRRMGYDDRAAHDMALMAMGQYGTALAAASPRLRPADAEADIRAACAVGAVPVWRPWPMLRDAADVDAGWHVTSDSLALVLATRLAARSVLLLKQVSHADDLVDDAFPAYRARFRGAVWVAGPDDAPAALDPEHPPGRRLS
jgi:aspartokinase-like uncharacterized kinase